MSQVAPLGAATAERSCQTEQVASCPKCEGFRESFNIDEPRQYLDIAAQLMEVVSDGTFLMVHATCPLQDLFKAEWPGNIVEHNFQCTECGRSYQLFADTFHGRASWDLIGPPVQMSRP
jgi:hypothetical protein